MTEFNWYPKYRNIYQSWNDDGRNHRNHSHMSGRVTIHIGEKEYPGSFSVGNNSVTVRYERREIVVQKKLCRFTKRIRDRTVYYDAYFDEDSIKTNTKNGNDMTNEKNSMADNMSQENNKRGGEDRMQEKGGINSLIGKDEMIYIRNRYQAQLDSNYSQIKTIINYLKQVNDNTTAKQKTAEGLKENIEAHMKERDRAHTNLQNLLGKEEKYEEKMLDKTLKGMKAKGRVTLKQKMKDVDIDTMQYGSVEQYKRLYPRYGAEIFEKVNEVNKKEKEIREAQEAYNKEVSNYNYLLDSTNQRIEEGKSELKKYEKIRKEGETELKSCPYYKSIFYKLDSKKTKTLLSLDTLDHDIEGLEHQLDIIQKTFSAYTNQPLKPMKY